MKNMKIVMAIFITLIFSIINVNAGTIKYNDTYLYNPDGETGEVEGIIFNENENIITFKNYNKDLSSELVMQDMGNIIINIDGENSFYGAIYSTGNLTINGINNGIFNVYTTVTIGSDNDLTINDLNIRIASDSYSTGLSGNNVIINNSSIKGVSYDSFGIVGDKNNIIINNSNLIDMGSSYHYGDMGAINAYSSVSIINNSTVNIYPLGYDRNYDFLDVFNLGFAPYDYSHDYTDTWFDGRGILAESVTISDSTVNITGKRECMHSTNIETTNSNINLECFYGVVGSNMTVNSGNVIEKGAVVGIKVDILNVNGGYLSSSVMDDDTKAGFINYMENDSNESRAALEDIETYTPYMISIINYPDTYGMFINGSLPDSIGNPDDIIPYVNPGQYIRRGDQEIVERLVENLYNAYQNYENRANDPNVTQEELEALEQQINQIEQQVSSYLIDAADVDPNKIVIDKINTLEIKPLDGTDTNIIERMV